MPEDSASAGDVVTTYLAALDAHDCATAVALSTASFAGTARDWCDDIASVRAVTTGDPTAEDPAWSGLPATAEVVSVPVTFEIDWRLLRGDGSFAEGRADWGYLLTRPSADEPWRIISNGFA